MWPAATSFPGTRNDRNFDITHALVNVVYIPLYDAGSLDGTTPPNGDHRPIYELRSMQRLGRTDALAC